MRTYFIVYVALLLSGLSAYGETPEETIKRLKDSDPSTRAAAARALGKQKVEAAIPDLVPLLEDEDASVSNAVATALVRIGGKSVPALASALKDEHNSYRAVECLGRLGPAAKDARKELADLLKRDFPSIQAAVVLGELGQDAKDTLPELFEAAKVMSHHPKVDVFNIHVLVALAAIDAALKIDPQCADKLAKAAVPDLIELMKKPPVYDNDPPRPFAGSAASALAMLGASASDALPALKEALNESSYDAGGAAIAHALYRCGDKASKWIVEVFKDPNTGPKGVLSLLYGIEVSDANRDAVAALLKESLKGPPELGAAAAYACLRIGPDAKAVVPILVELLGDDRLEERRPDKAYAPESYFQPRLITSALAKIGRDALPALGAVLADQEKSGRVRSQAAFALAEFGPKAKSVLSTLKSAMKDDSKRLAVASAVAYVRAGGDLADALPVLRDGLKNTSKDVAVNAACGIARFGLAAQQAVPELIPMLKRDDVPTRIAAVRALAKMGAAARPAASALAAAFLSGTRDEQFEIGKAIQQLGPDGRDVIPPMVEYLKSLGQKDQEKTKDVVRLLAPIGAEAKPAAPVLLDLLKSSDDKVAGEVIVALSQIPAAADALPLLLDRLKKSREPYWIVEAIGLIGPDAKEAIPVLEKFLKGRVGTVARGPDDVDWYTRVAAIAALARIKQDSKPYVSMLTDMWQDEEDNSMLSHAIPRALESLGTLAQPARDQLIEAVSRESKVTYSDGQPEDMDSRRAAARALGHLGSDADVIVPKLIELIERPSKTHRKKDDCELATTVLGMLGAKAKAALPAIRKLLDNDDEATVEAAATAIEKIEVK